ncbi:hypothetical protein [Tahibacter amnicola]|uniref:MarR family transcriptional regulator n=1 Tax=Tahibacter amnicola TaxID=2976241 RepID=A0ABY6BK29_9GAMM|nr:hypothetical protein [Tahibacter amnicola]UXI69961.1 hypothetical protein N4264_10140 [Tahibacter amnicola]
MNENAIPVKTLEGQREVTARRYNLPARTRAVLISIQGSLAVHDIRDQFRGLGDVDKMLRELEAAGLVRMSEGAEAARSTMEKVDQLAGPGPSPLVLAKQFMRTTALAAAGVRAMFFVWALDRRESRSELEQLLARFHRLLSKSRGEAFAGVMVRRVDYLLLRAQAQTRNEPIVLGRQLAH